MQEMGNINGTKSDPIPSAIAVPLLYFFIYIPSKSIIIIALAIIETIPNGYDNNVATNDNRYPIIGITEAKPTKPITNGATYVTHM